MFSFKNIRPGNENTPVSLIDRQAAELAAERDLNAAIEDSGNARQTELEAIRQTNLEGCSSTVAWRSKHASNVTSNYAETHALWRNTHKSIKALKVKYKS
ncbi:hypothetical protein HOO65_110061 [Ceratocystis lukuohia]|uniref:Uncharacterized protein n=1 Tax=Ceratocystis lukuohia TaxID=2019550 RepID=A0ABR4M8I7_9PEZI